MSRESDPEPLHIVMASIHGLVRGNHIELGRDADTGGQVKYVVELARALSRRSDVASVDIYTRAVSGKTLDPEYSRPIETLSPKARIVRLPCGPPDYLPKETLWPHLDEFRRNLFAHLRTTGRDPDVIHAHYADAGLACADLAADLDRPMVFTGHSLGRIKRSRLLAKTPDRDGLERRYRFTRRIAAEERALHRADLVITSTRQEADQQYAVYENREPGKIATIPPGVDLERFRPPVPGDPQPDIARQIGRFLKHPYRPMILAMARPDERKNFQTLIRAYGEDETLRRIANLVMIIGNRSCFTDMGGSEQAVMEEVLALIDKYDLYGTVAYPKHHASEDVPDIYRLAVLSEGVFINPAFTEPFGLTLLEAAATGLPVVATRDGGPRDIIGHCRNGILVDPTDPAEIANALKKILKSSTLWFGFSANGLTGVQGYYSWTSHADLYMKYLRALSGGNADIADIRDETESAMMSEGNR